MKRTIFLSIVVLLAMASLTQAETRLVPSQYPTIQAAIDDCNDGDTVVVADGNYIGEGNGNIDLLGKAITVRSENGPEGCIISGSGDSWDGFILDGINDANVVIDGFTIRDFRVAVWCHHSSIIIKNCILTENEYGIDLSGSGGVIGELGRGELGSKAELYNCTIINNGGGITGVCNGIKLISCNVSNNATGGIFIMGARGFSLFEIHNCIINYNGNNSKYSWGGITVLGGYDNTINITGCEISGNGEHGISIDPDKEGADLVQVNNCIITNNNGCGISNGYGNTIISDCDISYNREGGIQGRGSVTVNGCEIRGNTNDFGGAIRAFRLTVTNSVITQNSAELGGAIYLYSGGRRGYGTLTMTTIRNCTIIGNLATDKGGEIAIYDYGEATNLIANSVIRDNFPEQISSIYSAAMPPVSVIHSNIQGGWDGDGFGNVDVDPMFELAGYWADVNGANVIVEPNDPNAVWVDGDYHLLLDSPCIDTGDPNYVAEANETDLDGHSRIVNGVVDMGAYEADHVEAELRMLPRTISRYSQQPMVLGIVYLPEDITRNQIDRSQKLLLYPGGIEARRQHVLRYGKGRQIVILAFFDKAKLAGAVAEDGRVELQILGKLKSGRGFYGNDTVRIKGR